MHGRRDNRSCRCNRRVGRPAPGKPPPRRSPHRLNRALDTRRPRTWSSLSSRRRRHKTGCTHRHRMRGRGRNLHRADNLVDTGLRRHRTLQTHSHTPGRGCSAHQHTRDLGHRDRTVERHRPHPMRSPRQLHRCPRSRRPCSRHRARPQPIRQARPHHPPHRRLRKRRRGGGSGQGQRFACDGAGRGAPVKGRQPVSPRPQPMAQSATGVPRPSVISDASTWL